MVVCYMDFDGCCHPDAVYLEPGRGVVLRTPGHALFMWAPTLRTMLLQWPDVKIVLSTSWVARLGYKEALSYLMPELRERVIGTTFDARSAGGRNRGEEIAADLAWRRPARWFAIDDAVEQFSADQLPWLVACNSMRGLSDDATQRRLREVLEQVHREAP